MKVLHIPVYADSSGNKCHFKDVVMGLTKLALFRSVQDQTDFKDVLTEEWSTRYEELKRRA